MYVCSYTCSFFFHSMLNMELITKSHSNSPSSTIQEFQGRKSIIVQMNNLEYIEVTLPVIIEKVICMYRI